MNSLCRKKHFFYIYSRTRYLLTCTAFTPSGDYSLCLHIYTTEVTTEKQIYPLTTHRAIFFQKAKISCRSFIRSDTSMPFTEVDASVEELEVFCFHQHFLKTCRAVGNYSQDTLSPYICKIDQHTSCKSSRLLIFFLRKFFLLQHVFPPPYFFLLFPYCI
jgi:hypothetical protein